MDSETITSEQRDAILMRVRTEVATQAMQELAQTIQQKCYDKCITRPSDKLDNKQQSCLSLCVDRYVETTQVVSNAMMNRSQTVRKVKNVFHSIQFSDYSYYVYRDRNN